MEASVRLLHNSLRATSRISLSHPLRSARIFTTTALRPQEEFPSTAPSSRSTVTPSISRHLDNSLDMDKGPHATRQSRFPGAGARNPPTRHSDFGINTFAKEITSKQPSASSLDIDAMFGNSPYGFGSGKNSTGPPSAMPSEPETSNVKLDPTVGRHIRVDNNRGMDVGKAFRTLEMQCSRNSVRKDFMRQRFHERPGLKRKRLKSERWRRNFKKAFKETVGMVVRMKRQGW